MSKKIKCRIGGLDKKYLWFIWGINTGLIIARVIALLRQIL